MVWGLGRGAYQGINLHEFKVLGFQSARYHHTFSRLKPKHPAAKMVIGLLMLTAIPTVAGVSLGIAERDKKVDPEKEKQLLRKFKLSCWCEGKSKGKSKVHGGNIVLGEGKVCHPLSYLSLYFAGTILELVSPLLNCR